MRAKNRETTKVTDQTGTEPRSSATRTVQIASITVTDRHRKAMGDLQSLANSIAEEGLLQPIGITEDCRLVFGERRLRACRDILGCTEIEARGVNVSSIVAGEHAENEIRKDFTASERVAIGQTIEKELGNRQGQRTDRGLPESFPKSSAVERRGKLRLSVLASATRQPTAKPNRWLPVACPSLSRRWITARSRSARPRGSRRGPSRSSARL